MLRSPFRLLVLAMTAALTTVALAVPAQAAAPSCGITWGSLAKSGPTSSPVPGAAVGALRAGRHDCYDRLVLDVHGATSMGTWRAEYVRAVTEDPSGRTVGLRGGAFLRISVGAPPSPTGRPVSWFRSPGSPRSGRWPRPGRSRG